MQEIIVPAAGESVTEADIVAWQKQTGDYVEVDDVLLELETDKASLEMTAESSGVLTILIEEGTVNVGDKLGVIEPSEAKPQQEKPVAETPVVSQTSNPQKEASSAPHYASGHPSPSAEKLLNENKVSVSEIAGTGKEGRITKADAQAAVAAKPIKAAAPASETAPVQSSNESFPTRIEKMTRLRKTISKKLVQAKLEQAQLSTFNEVDLTEVMNLRKLYKENFKDKYGVGLGFMSFFTKAVCLALKEFPIMNAQVGDGEIIYNDFANISIAVASPKGLVVPVIKNAQNMNFQEIEASILGFAKKAKEGSLSIEEMEGGTFTITNGGTFGSMLSTPIVNFPQSAILGMHNIVQRPMVVNGEIKIRPIMYLAVSYDHRIIDGSDAVRFLVAVKQRLEDPSRLLIEI